MGNLIINDNTFLRQFEVEIDEDLAKIEYALQDRKIFLTKLIIPYSNSNPDFEETFIREVFEIIKALFITSFEAKLSYFEILL